jgi:heat shock protein HtpX
MDRNGGDRKGSGRAAIIIVIVAVLLIALAWLLSQLVRLALSRSREYLADAGSVELTKNPDAMISALRKIEGRGELPGATSAVMELCVDSPREGFSDLFATHPSVRQRVQALVKFASGHDPGPLALPAPPPGPWDTPQTPLDGPTQSSTPSGPSSGPWGPHGNVGGPPAQGPSEGPGAICRAHGAAARFCIKYAGQALCTNDFSRDYSENPLFKELKSPSFLPCSRPKQGQKRNIAVVKATRGA